MVEPRDPPTDTREMSRDLRRFAIGASVVALTACLGLLLAGVACASPAEPVRLAVSSPLCDQTAAWLGPSSPPACWRPYADSSPFNQRIPRGARVTPDSARVVRRLLSFGPLAAPDWPATRAGRTTSGARPTSTIPTIRSSSCTARMPWGTCAVEGRRIRIPDAARVPGGSDGHLTVVDRATGWEYDFWRVQSKPRGGGRLAVGWGGRTHIDGDGLGSNAVAARFGTLAGTLRPEEIQAGRINHALALSVQL